MDKKVNEQKRSCFIITPIGDTASVTFRRTEGVIESVIKPILFEDGFDDVKPAYGINVSGMITTQIINRIINDDLVIANLTGNNPNVMYELCLRHIVAKPIIHICENGTTLPFDIRDSRTIFYENDMLGVNELKGDLRKYVKEIDFNKEYSDNPIYIATQMSTLFKSISEDTESIKNTEQIGLLQKIYERLENNNRQIDSTIYHVGEDNKGRDYIIKIGYTETEQIMEIVVKLQEELSRCNLKFRDRNGKTLFFTSMGDVSVERVKEIASYVGKCYNADISVMRLV